MSKFIALLLLMVAPLACGFTWGIGHSDPCVQANKLLQDLPNLKDREKQKKQEERILQLCAEGTAGKFVKALQLERQGRVADAVTAYRETVQAADAPAEAHGNLGLLLAGTGHADEASVELMRGLLAKADPRYHRALAGILAAAKVYPLALFHYGEAAKAFPGDGAIQESMGRCYRENGEAEKAEASYLKALQLEPDRLSAQLAVADLYRNRSRLPEAITFLEKAAEKNPRNREIHRLLGETFQEKGDIRRARAEFKLAGIDVSIDPEDFMRNGDEYLAARSFDKAAVAYRTALKGKPDWREAQLKLAQAEMAAGHDDAAIEAYLKASHAARLDAGGIYNLGVLYERKGMLEEAIGAYQQALQNDPRNGDILRRLADIFYLRGNFARSIALYEELIRLRGENPLLHLKLSEAYEKNRDYKSAIAEYQRALQLDPDNLQTHKELAALYRRNGSVDASIAQYREVLRLKKGDAEARSALTALFVKKKRYNDLLTLLKEGVAVAPEDPGSHYKLGLVYEFRKDFPSAIAEYQRTIELQPNHAKGLNALGRLYLKTGRLDEARLQLQSAKKADPTFAEPQMLLATIQADLAAQDAAQKPQLRLRKKAKHPEKGARTKKRRKHKARR